MSNSLIDNFCYRPLNTMAMVSGILFVILVTLSEIPAVIQYQGNFRSVKTSSGQPVCSVDQPTYVVENVRSMVECSMRCLCDKDCTAVNYLASIQSCAVFNATVQLYSPSDRIDCQLSLVNITINVLSKILYSTQFK